MSKKDLVVGDREIKSTRNYDVFKTMHGNRDIKGSHVNELKRLLVENGNLTNQFPIIVNKQMEVIDGQHRLQALRELGWEVAYVVEDGATINMVRAINLGNRNWNWRDIAESYSNLGNGEYSWFLRYIDTHNLSFTVALRFCNTTGTNGRYGATSDFNQGHFNVKEKTKAVEMAEHYSEVLKAMPEEFASREFALALHSIRKSAFYNDERMIEKLKEKGHTLPKRATTQDYMRLLEEIFNDSRLQENKVRLF